MTYRVANAKNRETLERDGVKVFVQTEDEPVPEGYAVIASGLSEEMADIIACLYIQIMEDEARRFGAKVLPENEPPTLALLAARHALHGLSRKRRNADLRQHGYAPSDEYRRLLTMAMIGRDTIHPFVRAREN